MLIKIDKETKQIIQNYGTNSAFPDGNIPNVSILENEEFVRINDNSELAEKILLSHEYDFNEDFTDITVIKTIEEYQIELQNTTEYKRQSILNQLSELDVIVPRIVEDIIAQSTFVLHQSKLDIIAQKQALRQELNNL